MVDQCLRCRGAVPRGHRRQRLRLQRRRRGARPPRAGPVRRIGAGKPRLRRAPAVAGYRRTIRRHRLDARGPRALQAKLPQLLGLLLRKGYAAHPQIMFGAIGDATCDRAPLQVGQFESDNRMDDDLSRILLEGGGGGQKTESYELALYFMARHTAAGMRVYQAARTGLFRSTTGLARRRRPGGQVPGRQAAGSSACGRWPPRAGRASTPPLG